MSCDRIVATSLGDSWPSSILQRSSGLSLFFKLKQSERTRLKKALGLGVAAQSSHSSCTHRSCSRWRSMAFRGARDGGVDGCRPGSAGAQEVPAASQVAFQAMALHRMLKRGMTRMRSPPK
eukprot:CAMPEP_0115873154 /NCGR_PEP_ID=MMETSP0287-20121206/23836_1 /TAXON_ID=412157 /ORGANISM="Chrysochromulina rotalis, Strain UIO044" /LENGTH=120 /DNA_ID=CAMNT_0003328179 /DNA_START=190 /DNA_END=552 /DNA_ORIENTATION=-